MKVNLLTIRLKVNSHLKPRVAEKIRGYFGNLYREDSLFHQHAEDGRVLYRYPMIQYKIIKGVPYIIGVGSGAETLRDKFIRWDRLLLEDCYYEILEKNLILRQALICSSPHQISYEFLSPWYALNQINFQKYRNEARPGDRNSLLKRILIGNILSLCKSFDETVRDEIVIEDLNTSECNLMLDDVQLIGFIGRFRANFHIPDLLGLGKAVSRGFGTIIKINSPDAQFGAIH